MNTATKIMDKMEEIGIAAVIAGGYPRDILHEVKPRDIDIIVQGTFKDMGTLYSYLKENDLLLQEPTFTDTDRMEYADSRIWCVFKVKTSGVPIDIIFWNSADYEGLDEVVVYGFDYNINQYILRDGKPEFLGSNAGNLTQVRADLTEKRKRKMKRVAGKLRWKL